MTVATSNRNDQRNGTLGTEPVAPSRDDPYRERNERFALEVCPEKGPLITRNQS
jgi:hypothetical protein